MCSPGRPGVIISAASSLPPMTIGVLTTRGRKFISGGVEGDSPPLRLTWRLHCLLIWGCWPTPGGWEWLVQGWCHLRGLWWWGLWQWALQHLSPQHLSLPFYSSFSFGWPSQWEAGIMGMLVALGAEGSPEEICSKWRNLEG